MLRDKLNEALKEAMRARDMVTVGAVRLIIAKLKEVDIAARTEASRELSQPRHLRDQASDSATFIH